MHFQKTGSEETKEKGKSLLFSLLLMLRTTEREKEKNILKTLPCIVYLGPSVHPILILPFIRTYQSS